jgi:hypothetical protein
MNLKTALKGAIAVAALCLGYASSTAPALADNLRCDSRPGGYNYCRANTKNGVSLKSQHTRHACYQNDTWGYDRNGVWVSNGCSATFRIGKDDGDTAAAIGLGILALGVIGAIASQDDNDDQDDYPPPSAPPPGYDPNYPPDQQYPDGSYPPPDGDDPYDPYDNYGGTQVISCDSKNYKRRYCPAPVRNYAQLVQQRSKRACRFNKSWGYDQGGVWVNKGCRGEFAIY